MLAYIRSHTRGGATNNVGRIERNSPGIFDKPSLNHTGMPCRITSSSSTSRCVMCAEAETPASNRCCRDPGSAGPSRSSPEPSCGSPGPFSARPSPPRSGTESPCPRAARRRGCAPASPGSSTIAWAPNCPSRSRLIAFSASPVNRIRCAFTSFSPRSPAPAASSGFPRRWPSRGRLQRLHLVGRGQAGVHRRRDRAVGHHAHVGQVELGARLRRQPTNIAVTHSQRAQPRRDLFRGLPVFDPVPALVRPAALGLVQGRRAAEELGRRVQHVVNSPALPWQLRWHLGHTLQILPQRHPFTLSLLPPAHPASPQPRPLTRRLSSPE